MSTRCLRPSTGARRLSRTAAQQQRNRSRLVARPHIHDVETRHPPPELADLRGRIGLGEVIEHHHIRHGRPDGGEQVVERQMDGDARHFVGHGRQEEIGDGVVVGDEGDAGCRGANSLHANDVAGNYGEKKESILSGRQSQSTFRLFLPRHLNEPLSSLERYLPQYLD